MEFTVQQIADLLKGEVKGDANRKLYRIAGIQEAKTGDIAFLANMKYESHAYTTQASAVIVNKDFVARKHVNSTLILVEDAYTAFSQLLSYYQQLNARQRKGIEQPSFIAATARYGENFYLGAFAYVGENAKIGRNVKIHPQVYVGENVSIGDNTVIYPGVKIYADSMIGSHCTIHAGAVIGSDGFGFAPQDDGSYKTVPQIGNVVIGDHVDIGANTVIDRATMKSTVIESGVKLDNLIQIAHNVRLGKNTVIAALTGVSGSTQVGENCMIAGQVGIAGHLEIANRTGIGAQAGIIKSIKQEGTNIVGSPAIDVKDYFKSYAVFKKLPELFKRIDTLEAQHKEK